MRLALAPSLVTWRSLVVHRRTVRICLIGDINSILVRRWIDYLVDSGHTVHVMSHTEGSYARCEVTYVNWSPEPRVKYLSFARHIAQLVRRIRAEKADIVHQHYLTFSGLAPLLLRSAPFVISVWGSDIYQFAELSRRNLRIVRFILEHCDAITTTSVAMREQLVHRFGLDEEKITTFSWGVDLPTFSQDRTAESAKLREGLAIPERSPVVLSIRHFRERYGIADIIKSIPDVLAKHPEAFFVFVGGWIDREFHAHQRQFIDRQGIQENVRVIARMVEPAEMAALLQMATIFVSVPYWDQLSSSVLEGMACGAIPIVGRLEVYKEVIEDGVNGFLVPLHDSGGLAERLCATLSDSAYYRETFARLNRKLISEHHDWSVQAPNMLGVYEQVRQGWREQLPVC